MSIELEIGIILALFPFGWSMLGLPHIHVVGVLCWSVCAVLLADALRKSPARRLLRSPKLAGRYLLAKRAKQLARRINGFLERMGPRPDPALNDRMSPEEIVHAALKARGPWVEKIHYTYRGEFEPQLQVILDRLHAAGFHDYEIDRLMNRQIQNAESLREIASRLADLVLESK